MLFEIEAAALAKLSGYTPLARAAVVYGLACERFRKVAKESNAATADLDACLTQLNEIQLAMDQAWHTFKTRLAAERKALGGNAKAPEPQNLFSTKKRKQKSPTRGPGKAWRE